MSKGNPLLEPCRLPRTLQIDLIKHEVFMSNFVPVISSPEGKAEVMRDYQVIMDHWPVAFNELTVPTSFGETYVIVSGPVDAPPVILLHALLATAASWYRNVEALSRSYRVYVIDIVGEGNKTCALKP